MISSSGSLVLFRNLSTAMDSSAAMSLYTFSVTNVVSDVGLDKSE